MYTVQLPRNLEVQDLQLQDLTWTMHSVGIRRCNFWIGKEGCPGAIDLVDLEGHPFYLTILTRMGWGWEWSGRRQNYQGGRPKASRGE